ncbi:uncharacterized protein STEHIDRAFT_112983 [Stereum hirsutum FP-91666 SS1]|uniref:uncharacterized protein n=1 Tax=Stereum hirsutum (strain FP-91666) TaxID=721885 RepID=UPI0004449AB3|nr:uncharacterized protein STEHIDRAFT_112983 [Stereum hirsutum FP-91666 SS1]EIM83700.1 hypothetical protein STEHIDRAFT_112983 [Stereum hirsutum FP-91666 SS1]
MPSKLTTTYPNHVTVSPAAATRKQCWSVRGAEKKRVEGSKTAEASNEVQGWRWPGRVVATHGGYGQRLLQAPGRGYQVVDLPQMVEMVACIIVLAHARKETPPMGQWRHMSRREWKALHPNAWVPPQRRRPLVPVTPPQVRATPKASERKEIGVLDLVPTQVSGAMSRRIHTSAIDLQLLPPLPTTPQAPPQTLEVDEQTFNRVMFEMYCERVIAGVLPLPGGFLGAYITLITPPPPPRPTLVHRLAHGYHFSGVEALVQPSIWGPIDFVLPPLAQDPGPEACDVSAQETNNKNRTQTTALAAFMMEREPNRQYPQSETYRKLTTMSSDSITTHPHNATASPATAPKEQLRYWGAESTEEKRVENSEREEGSSRIQRWVALVKGAAHDGHGRRHPQGRWLWPSSSGSLIGGRHGGVHHGPSACAPKTDVRLGTCEETLPPTVPRRHLSRSEWKRLYPNVKVPLQHLRPLVEVTPTQVWSQPKVKEIGVLDMVPSQVSGARRFPPSDADRQALLSLPTTATPQSRTIEVSAETFNEVLWELHREWVATNRCGDTGTLLRLGARGGEPRFTVDPEATVRIACQTEHDATFIPTPQPSSIDQQRHVSELVYETLASTFPEAARGACRRQAEHAKLLSQVAREARDFVCPRVEAVLSEVTTSGDDSSLHATPRPPRVMNGTSDEEAPATPRPRASTNVGAPTETRLLPPIPAPELNVDEMVATIVAKACDISAPETNNKNKTETTELAAFTVEQGLNSPVPGLSHPDEVIMGWAVGYLSQRNLENATYHRLRMAVDPSHLADASEGGEVKLPGAVDMSMYEAYRERLAMASSIEKLRIPRPTGVKYCVDFEAMADVATRCEEDFIRPYVPGYMDDGEVREETSVVLVEEVKHGPVGDFICISESDTDWM